MSIEVKMPIASLLRENPTLWHDLSDWMNGHLDSMTEAHEENWTKEESNSEEDTQMVPINKLAQYFESDDSNAVIPLSYHQRNVEAILDGGAGVSIMTKQCWEKWGSLPMEKISLVVKLADGTTTRPVGVVDLTVKTLGLTYHVWFMVMDFKNPIDSYDIILGRQIGRAHV